MKIFTKIHMKTAKGYEMRIVKQSRFRDVQFFFFQTATIITIKIWAISWSNIHVQWVCFIHPKEHDKFCDHYLPTSTNITKKSTEKFHLIPWIIEFTYIKRFCAVHVEVMCGYVLFDSSCIHVNIIQSKEREIKGEKERNFKAFQRCASIWFYVLNLNININKVLSYADDDSSSTFTLHLVARVKMHIWIYLYIHSTPKRSVFCAFCFSFILIWSFVAVFQRVFFFLCVFFFLLVRCVSSSFLLPLHSPMYEVR